MTTYFFDTSALVKRYHEEPGTKRVDEILDDEEHDVLISSLTVVESVSAFRRKYNRNEVSEPEMNQLISVFFREALADFVIVPMEESLLGFSFDLVLQNDLRTLDSLQLSAALSLSERIEQFGFVSADEELVEVAAQRGLETILPG
ncbi:type II toxin-antitoxin system VapC family toxin [Salinigranum salinum]|uniref:type II toxin-antitoxin system VapC family toxin n=1 Tax=Salinigranum salinum TaxID=1364937 RepID=UPI001261146E|nr:type II toxin-antitoxin system VapC family toxin [Salinigranum salinum]